MERKRLTIIWHSRTGGSKALSQAAAAGAVAAAPEIDTMLRGAEDVDAGDLIASDALLFVGPENLASLSGAMKEMLDRNYYACLGKIEGRPFATIICAGSDGSGAQRQIDRIATGWRLRRVAEPMIVVTGAQSAADIAAEKIISDDALAAAADLGSAMAAGLAASVF